MISRFDYTVAIPLGSPNGILCAVVLLNIFFLANVVHLLNRKGQVPRLIRRGEVRRSARQEIVDAVSKAESA